MAIQVLRSGLLTSIQDFGRFGYQRYGVVVGGAMDSFALRVANLLIGNEEKAAVLEMTLMGPSLNIDEDTLISITGGNLSPTLDGCPLPQWRPIFVKKGSVLKFGGCVSGCRAYLAVAGGFDLPQVMGSQSTYLRAQIGGYQGRALNDGDVIHTNAPSDQALQLMKNLANKLNSQSFAATDWLVSTKILPGYKKNPVVRVIRGSHFESFTAESREQFFLNGFKITPQSDRMGYRLEGPDLRLSEPMELVSEAVAEGTIQVPPNGKPIVLLADRQTTGGYPRIAQVATVDLPILAQAKPGEKIQFQEISLEDAQREYLFREIDFLQLKQGIGLQKKK